MATWPAEFCALINTYNESPPDNVIRSSMDKGPAKVRRRTTANIRPISFRMSLTPAQTQIMDAFYNTDTVSGADPFDFINPRTKEQVRARFTQPPSYSDQSGKRYMVDISLEILP